MPARARSLAALALWLPLGGWIGAWLLFAGVVAPAAFRVLPTRELAGDLVGRILPALHFYGIAAGLGLAALGAARHRGRLAVLLPVALAALCAFSQLAVSPRIDALRPAVRAGDASPEDRARFGRLHALSVALYGATGLGALALAGLHARADAEKTPDFS